MAGTAKERSNIYRDLIETAPDAILLVASDGLILFCNRRAGDMFGYDSGKELCDKIIYSFVQKEQRGEAEQRIKEVLRTRNPESIELLMLREDGKGFPVEATISIIENAADRPEAFSLFLRDISARKKSEESSHALDRQLRAVYKMEALGQLAQGIAHDLNNSLGAISGYADLIDKMGFAGDSRLKKYTGMIGAAAERSAGLINKLLTFARKGKMQIIPFDANEIIADNIALLKSTLESNITVVQELRAKPATVVGDPSQLQNAIINLAVNARDAMSSGGTLTIKTAPVYIDENAAQSRSFKMTPGNYLQIVIADTGCGMDKETLGHLFEPFFTTKEVGKGTGLGLASVYGTVKSHHGYIEVDSILRQGSTFTLYLPLAQGARVPKVAAGDDAAAIAKTIRHIMVVDDELTLREMVSELLGWLGYRVTAFAESPRAVEFFKTHSNEVDLVILDWKMPDLDGIHCCRKLKAVKPEVKVLISTGFCLEDDRDRFLKEGVTAILPKPFVSAELAKAVADALS
jgi:PAS domain S-box-containing protein